MEIRIITIHSIHNFGSVLQAYALQKFLLNSGYSVEVIDYRPTYLDQGRKKWRTYLGRLLNLRSYFKRKKKFNDFIGNNIKTTPKCFFHFNELYQLDRSSIVFIAGGDQLWNDYHFSGQDESFKLTFVNKGTKMAFGTSMGRDNYSKPEIDNLINKVKDFKFIGLREKSSVQFLIESKYKNIKHVVDPVLLLDIKEYENILIEPKLSKKYVVVYLVKKSKLLDQIIKYIRDNFDYEIVHICGFVKKCDNDHFEKHSGPQEILGYIKNAEMIISGSYHATLFSIYFNKQFVSLLPHENTNARIIELLKMIGLFHRIIRHTDDLSKISQIINYATANSIIKNFIDDSKSDLLSNL